jgi:hypothetical protein
MRSKVLAGMSALAVDPVRSFRLFAERHETTGSRLARGGGASLLIMPAPSPVAIFGSLGGLAANTSWQLGQRTSWPVNSAGT